MWEIMINVFAAFVRNDVPQWDGRMYCKRLIVTERTNESLLIDSQFVFRIFHDHPGEVWTLGEMACQTWLFLDYSLCLVSILTVLLITIDRFLSVCHAAAYMKWQCNKYADVSVSTI